ncbi:MAG: hypothetical protein ACKOSQ_02700 [Planctomycetaceae bacterium]
MFAVVAAILLWGAFRPFTTPPEEPTSGRALLEESADLSRFSEEFIRLSRERRQITDAIDEQVKALEARRAASPDGAALDDELRRLRQESLAELKTTNRLLAAKNAEWQDKKQRGDAGRREQIARAAYEWQRGRWRVLAMAAVACVLSGWLFFRANVLHRRPADAWAQAAAGGPPHATVDRELAHASDPQWNQKLGFYVFQLAVCIGAILFGLLGSAPPAGAKDQREGLVVVGIAGLAMSTIWLFFGSIDWSTWNAIKGVATGKRSAGDDAESKSDGR